MRKRVVINVILPIILLTFVTSANAKTAFMYSCKDIKTQTYRYLTKPNGKVQADGWENERFNSTWKIRYSGVGTTIYVDGEEGVVFFVNNTAIAVVHKNNRGTSQSVWSYGINLKSNKVAATQVNVHNVMGSGTKARAVDFACTRLRF